MKVAQVTFAVSPAQAALTVRDASGETVAPTDAGGRVYQLYTGTTYTYTATASCNSLKIEASPAQAAAQVAISVNGKNLRNGGTATLTASALNPITVTVTQGNAVRVYTLNITGAAGG